MLLKLNLYTMYTIFAACEKKKKKNIYIKGKTTKKKEKKCEIKGNNMNILLRLINIRLFHP